MNDIIEHHGVKGQRWGVRKQRVSIGSGAKKAASSTLSAIKKVNTHTAPARIARLNRKAKRNTIKKRMSYGLSVVYGVAGKSEEAAKLRKAGRRYSSEATRLNFKVSDMKEKYGLD